jgi:2'-hydroxyisoflavone reductase
VRDLAAFMVRAIEDQRSGIYNLAGPSEPLMAPDFYRAAAKAVGGDITLVFVDDYAFLAEHRIQGAIPWAMLRGNSEGMMSIKNARAVAHGLTFRPLDVTVRDTLAWWPSVPQERRNNPKFAIKPEQEATALAAWKARKPS